MIWSGAISPAPGFRHCSTTWPWAKCCPGAWGAAPSVLSLDTVPACAFRSLRGPGILLFGGRKVAGSSSRISSIYNSWSGAQALSTLWGAPLGQSTWLCARIWAFLGSENVAYMTLICYMDLVMLSANWFWGIGGGLAWLWISISSKSCSWGLDWDSAGSKKVVKYMTWALYIMKSCSAHSQNMTLMKYEAQVM